MICIPLVNRMSGRLAIFHPLEYSFIKNSGAYLKILKEPLRRNWNLALQAWLRIHFKPHQRKKSEKQKFPPFFFPPPKRYP